MYRLVLLLALIIVSALPQHPATAATAPRRVNAPRFEGDVDWSSAAIFWFGKVGWDGKAKQAPIPGPNYVDMRVAYTPANLQVMVTVVDYYLWYNQNPQPADDLTQYDAVALYLDTAGARSSAPQPGDYRFLSGWRGGDANDNRWHRQARGTGAGWDTSWNGAWTDRPGSQWSDTGPNNNGGNIDYGWASTFFIPWSTLGLNGPPDGKTVGMGVQLFDRDAQPPAGAGPIQTWPEALDAQRPATWSELHLGLAGYSAPFASIEGQATIRRGVAGSQVIDATVGADGSCNNGHNGDPDEPLQGDSETSLFVESQAAITDFPCFSRSYLRFGLNQVPAGKVIVRAELTLHLWGTAGNLNSSNPGDRPTTSFVQLFSVDGEWTEAGLTWNNSPLARQHLSGTWVKPTGLEINWPKVPYTWDATAAVAEAYAAGKPLDIALYTADTNMHSSKYFTSSDAEDWNALGRPTLVVTWGAPTQATSRMQLPIVRR